jgi:hypothetical protein
VRYLLDVIVTTLQFGLSFYGFWLVWRVLLPDLPGPPDQDDRIAPYARYFTDPFLMPAAKALRLSLRLIALMALAVVAGLSVGLDRLPGLLV